MFQVLSALGSVPITARKTAERLNLNNIAQLFGTALLISNSALITWGEGERWGTRGELLGGLWSCLSMDWVLVGLVEWLERPVSNDSERKWLTCNRGTAPAGHVTNHVIECVGVCWAGDVGGEGEVGILTSNGSRRSAVRFGSNG